MSDKKDELIKSIQESLLCNFDASDVYKITNIITTKLKNYDVRGINTEVAIIDDYNDKILRRYIACLKIEGKSDKTIYQYKRTCTKLADFIHKNYNEIGTYDIRLYLAYLYERGVGNRSLENQRSYISAFYKWMHVENNMASNPCEPIKTIKYKVEIRKPFNEIEIDMMRSACKNAKERAILEILLSSGVRCNELATMKIEDVDLNNLSVHVKNGKGNKERTTYITPIAKKYLLDYLNMRQDNDPYLFLSKNKTPITTSGIREVLHRIGVSADVSNVHPHRFRRTLATHLADRGMAVQEIQKILGHSNINTTLTYVYTNDLSTASSYRKYNN